MTRLTMSGRPSRWSCARLSDTINAFPAAVRRYMSASLPATGARRTVSAEAEPETELLAANVPRHHEHGVVGTAAEALP